MIYKQFFDNDIFQQASHKFAFILGRETEICFYELVSVLHAYGIDFSIFGISGNIVFISLPPDVDFNHLIERLAGTTKIFELQSPFSSPQFDKALNNYILALYKKLPEFKRNFALSYFGNRAYPKKINQIGLKLKFELKKNNFLVRFIGLKEECEVSTIISARETTGDKGIEAGIFDLDNLKYFGILVAVNDPRPWSQRDYEKPAGDKYSGMLPPKLARMMINLSAGYTSVSRDDTKGVMMVDPFCGSGNVLIEALFLNYSFIGTDISEKAVLDSKANIDWIVDSAGKFNLNTIPDHEIGHADATSIQDFDRYSPFLQKSKHIMVVTEPYLGKPKKLPPTTSQAVLEYGEIKDLYLAFLKNFKSILPQGSIFCIVFPMIETLHKESYSLYQNSVDEIKKIGYTELRPPLLYGRNYQVVKREIVFLKLI